MSLKATWPSAVYAKHQVEGINWMLNLEKNGYSVPNENYVVRGGILGDEMGLGKTIQALALIVNGAGTNSLLICPLAVRKQWEDAAAKCALNVFTAEKSGWERKEKRILNGKNLYIAHYDKVASSIEMFLTVRLDRVILDEAHRIRNTNTVTGANVLKIPAKYKWALTATPIVNKLDDAVTYLKFIGFQIATSGWSGKYMCHIPNVYLARTIHQGEAPAGLTMPPNPVIETRMLNFTNDDEERVYDGILKNIESQWRSAQALNGAAYQLKRFSILLRLRQISVNPQIYIKARQKEAFGWIGPEFKLPSRKFDEISHLMRESFEANETHRWIIFCQFHDEMDMLKEFLVAFPYIEQVLQYHGGMDMKERQKVIESSNSVSTGGKQDVILIQLQAGGTGLNLQHYDRIIYVSPWWTSSLLEQARGRAVRIGQKNIVKIYWLKLNAEEERFSIDEFMMDKANTKKDMGDLFLSWAHNNSPKF
jgi:SNF2 family DNA or RNA helicase